jgi:hypothetical protein
MANHENLMDVRSAYDTVAETYSAVIPDTSFEAPLDMAMVDHFIAHSSTSPLSPQTLSSS